MPRRVTILYCLAWIIYAVFVVIAFPVLRTTAAIPHFLLVGMGAWIYGTSRGLLIMIPSIFFHYILLGVLYADIFNWYQTKFTSLIINILIIELAGNLKLQLERIKATNEQLDQLVEKRNGELALMTDRLLENSEKMKIANAQKLHDTIGQQLTGIQLLSTSLSDQLLQVNNSGAAISLHLKNQTSKAHLHIRKISRLLFPVRIGHVGLVPALNELASCMNDIKPIKIKIVENNELPSLPEHLLLQLFRICQESIHYITTHLQANRLTVQIESMPSSVIMTIEHNGDQSVASLNYGAVHLLRYRLKQANGTARVETPSSTKQTAVFTFPFQPSTL